MRSEAVFPVAVLAYSIASGSSAFGRVVKPCTPGEPAHALAERELASIDRAVRSLAPGDSPSPWVARIAKLASTKCFETLDGVETHPKSGLSLKTYWEDGGFDRLRSTLAHGGAGNRIFWTEPSIRRALTLETAPNSPIAAMLCPAADEACGAESAGWELQATGLFELAGKLGRQMAQPRRRGGDCEAAARAAPARRRFAVWRDCFQATQEELTPTIRLPIGHTRAPKQGWLVITGRRGHYDFCDEIRAYDLATGSAYVVGSCSVLALEQDGSVNRKSTDDARRLTVELGYLSIERLREAAWMTLMLDELDRDVRHSVGVEVPPWLQITVDRDDSHVGGTVSRSFGSSTAHTRLSWDIVDNPRLVKKGTLEFPEDLNDVAAAHAMRLIRIAELSFVPGCPTARPPDSLAARARTGTVLHQGWAQALARIASCRRRC